MDQIFGSLDAAARAEFAATLTAIANSISSYSGACIVE
jgi:hypothetical protein